MKNTAKILPLAPCQRQVWLDQQAYPDSPHLNIGGLDYINGPLELNIFDQAVQLLVDNNEAMRLQPLTDGTQQLIDGWPEPLWTFQDLSASADVEA